jgi:hypothetical protein
MCLCQYLCLCRTCFCGWCSVRQEVTCSRRTGLSNHSSDASTHETRRWYDLEFRIIERERERKKEREEHNSCSNHVTITWRVILSGRTIAKIVPDNRFEALVYRDIEAECAYFLCLSVSVLFAVHVRMRVHCFRVYDYTGTGMCTCTCTCA